MKDLVANTTTSLFHPPWPNHTSRIPIRAHGCFGLLTTTTPRVQFPGEDLRLVYGAVFCIVFWETSRFEAVNLTFSVNGFYPPERENPLASPARRDLNFSSPCLFQGTQPHLPLLFSRFQINGWCLCSLDRTGADLDRVDPVMHR